MSLKNLTSNKKRLVIINTAFVILLLFYGGSYWYLRARTTGIIKKIRKAPKNSVCIPSGYYFEIKYGVGLSNNLEPAKGAIIYLSKVNSDGKVNPAQWLGYFYYPLWQLEVAIWRIKTFGCK
jgi:hypothetical protein